MITKEEYTILKNVSTGIEINYDNPKSYATFSYLYKEQYIIVKNAVFVLSGKGYQAIDTYLKTKNESIFKWVSFLITAISATAAVIAALK